VRPHLLAGILGASLLAAPAMAGPRQSLWSVSLLGGPVTFKSERPPNEEFAARAEVSRTVVGALEAGFGLGYISFGHLSDPFGGDGRLSYEADGRALNSFDLSVSTRLHPRFATFHPYLSLGAGAFAIQEYFPSVDPTNVSRQLKPGISAGIGAHGILIPALGFEFRRISIFVNGPEYDRNKDFETFLITLTKE